MPVVISRPLASRVAACMECIDELFRAAARVERVVPNALIAPGLSSRAKRRISRDRRFLVSLGMTDGG